MSSAVNQMITIMKQLQSMKDKDLSGPFGEALVKASTSFALAVGGNSRSVKEVYFQQVIDESAKIGLNFKTFASTTSSYGQYGGISVFLPSGVFGFAPGMTKASDKGIVYVKYFPNDSMLSCFVTKGYRVMCYNGNIGDTNQYKVTSPGSYDLKWHAFDRRISSIRVEPDVITQAEYDALQQQSSANAIQLEYQRRQNETLKNRIKSVQSSISGINDEVKDKEQSLKQYSQKVGEIEKLNKELGEQNDDLIRESNDNHLKSRVSSIEHFESFRNQYSRHEIGTNIVLTSIIVLLTLSLIQLSHIKN